MKRLRAAAIVASALALAMPAIADERSDMEAFMADYLELWNAHDAAEIAARFYRLDGAHPWGTAEGLKAEFDRLKAQGYDKSDTHSITGCVLGADAGQVELRYSRLKTDGSFMPPKDRTSLYSLRKFADGWRVTALKGLAAGEKMECPTR